MLIAGQRGQGPKKARRADPNPRPYDLTMVTQSYKGLDPAYKYVNVNLADESQGAEFYFDSGYRPVEEGKDGPKNPFRKVQTGNFVGRHGCVLMRIERDVAEQHDQYGLDGMRGQAMADAVSDLLKGQFKGQHAGVSEVGFDEDEARFAKRYGAHAAVKTDTGTVLAEV